MGTAIRDMLPYAIAVAISPIPMIAVVLLLTSKRGGSNGIAFVIGSAIGLAAIGAVVLLVTGAADDDPSNSSDTAKGIHIALGALLVVLAARYWRKRPPKGEEQALPGWMEALDDFTPPKSIGLALGLSVVNFKNLLLTIGAATSIAIATSDPEAEAGALALFVLIGVAGPAIPVGIYFAAGDRADEKLTKLKHWLAQNSNTIMAIVLLAIGIKVIIDGLTG